MKNEILQKAIFKWGREVQINKIQEEALELALVLNQLKCPTKSKASMADNLYNELADMTIMMAQARILFDKDRIDERVAYKLEKLDKKYLQNCDCTEERRTGWTEFKKGVKGCNICGLSQGPIDV